MVYLAVVAVPTRKHTTKHFLIWGEMWEPRWKYRPWVRARRGSLSGSAQRCVSLSEMHQLDSCRLDVAVRHFRHLVTSKWAVSTLHVPSGH